MSVSSARDPSPNSRSATRLPGIEPICEVPRRRTAFRPLERSVDDHADALLLVLENGEIGHSYNIGGENELTNLELVKTICNFMDRLSPRATGKYDELINFVSDRPGHDTRYAINPNRIRNELGWKPLVEFEKRLEKTVQWYLENQNWWKPLLSEPEIRNR